MNRETVWKRWRAGAPMRELAALVGLSVSDIEGIIRRKLIARDAKRRRRQTRKPKSAKRGAAKRRGQS